MAYTPATKYPSNSVLSVFQWARPSTPNPRLSAPVSSSATTLYFTSAPKDYSGTVLTTGFLMGVKNKSGYVETVYVPAGALSADGLTATGCVRGIRPEGLDYTTGDSSFAAAHDADSPVFCNVSATYHRLMIETLQGNIGTGGENWKMGNAANNDITVYAFNGDANNPFWRYDASANQWVYSNDGVSDTPFGTGAGLTGGTGITISGGSVDIDNTDLQANEAVTITSTSTEINRLDGISANVTASNLSTLTGGSDASSLHTHINSLGNFGNSSDWYCYQLSGSEAWTAVGAGTQLCNGYTSVNDATDAKSAYINLGAGPTDSFYFPWGTVKSSATQLIIEFYFSYNPNASTDDIDFHFGINGSTDFSHAYNGAISNDFAGFSVDGSANKLYAKTDDGATTTTTEIKDVAIDTYYFARIVCGTSDIKFYIDGTLEHTASTNLPTYADFRYIGFGEDEQAAIATNHQASMNGMIMAYKLS